MSRPDAIVPAPGRPIALEVLTAAGPVTARAAPITGEMELAVAAERARRPAAPAAAFETMALCSGAVECGGAALSPAQADALLVGDRARLVLAVLCAGYGAPRELVWTCPHPDCGAAQELPFDPAPILAAVATGPVGSVFPCASGVTMRLPVGADLTEPSPPGRPAAAALLARCAPGASAADLGAVETEIAARDPGAEIALAAVCIGCGRVGGGPVDPAALLLAEMDREGGVLAELDALARAYHWSEAELRAMPAHRRRMYLATIRAREAAEPARWAS